MNRILIWQLAYRYLRGKRAANVVPILSRISMVAIAVSSCAMIVLFSVFNGMEGLIQDLYKAFYPEIKISAAKGKFFTFDGQQVSLVKNIPGVRDLTKVIEDNVLLNSENEQRVATLKGIEHNYLDVNNVRPYIDQGRDSVTGYPVPTTIAGRQLLDYMGIEVDNIFNSITVYYPNSDLQHAALSPENSFQSLRLKPDGSFKVQDEVDGKYLLASLPLVQELLQARGKYSSIELSLDNNADAEDVQADLKNTLGPKFKVQTRYEQNSTLYAVMNGEKWAIYAILLLVLLIASFNMIGALSLLVLEKQKDMAILKAMGAESITVKSIFIAEGLLWSLMGGIIGLVIGTLICMGQQQFGWVKLEGSFIIDAYPVSIHLVDFALIICTILVVGIAASWYPATRAVKIDMPTLKTD